MSLYELIDKILANPCYCWDFFDIYDYIDVKKKTGTIIDSEGVLVAKFKIIKFGTLKEDLEHIDTIIELEYLKEDTY